jgi:hypothetical protein
VTQRASLQPAETDRSVEREEPDAGQDVRIEAGAGDRGPHPVISTGVAEQDRYGSLTANIRASIPRSTACCVSVPDNAWAIDARDGRVLWHFHWRSRGGTHIGNRGLGMWGNYFTWRRPTIT